MAKKPKRPRDPVQLAKLIGDLATGQAQPEKDTRNPAAVALGQKGGKARAEKLSKAKRSEIAKKGAESRWKDDGNNS